MPSQSHKSGHFVAVSVSIGGTATDPALAGGSTVQAWLLRVLSPVRYLVVASTSDDGDKCSACAVVGSPKRADNVRASLRKALPDVVVIDSVRVSNGSDDVRRAALLLQAAPPGAAIRLEGWDEAELRSPAAIAAVVAGKKPRLRWLPRRRAVPVLAAYMCPRTVSGGREPPHPDWALCPPDAACDACQAYSDAVYNDVYIDVPALLRAALQDGWDTSALHDTVTKEQLTSALADLFRLTYLRCSPPKDKEEEEPARKRKCTRSNDDDF